MAFRNLFPAIAIASSWALFFFKFRFEAAKDIKRIGAYRFWTRATS